MDQWFVASSLSNLACTGGVTSNGRRYLVVMPGIDKHLGMNGDAHRLTISERDLDDKSTLLSNFVLDCNITSVDGCVLLARVRWVATTSSEER